MVKLLLVIGALFAVTVSRTDGTVTIPTKTIKVQQDRTVLFSCVVTGESFVAWVTPAKPARPGSPAIPSVQVPASQTTPVNRRSIAVSGDTYELTIADVIVDDGGDYICLGSQNSAIFTLQVDFETKQVVAKQELHLGRRGVITLDVSAYPQLTYDWRKEGQQLTFPMAGKTLDPYTGSITIDNVQESDEGNYTCTVKFGTAATVEIEVTTIDEPKIRKYQGDPVIRILTQGYNATFHCDVESGHPKPEVTWYFDWTGIVKKVDPVYDSRFTHPTDETWFITGVETKDEGKYRCIATNKAGEDDLKFWITQVDVPPTIDPLTDTIANDGVKVDLECVAAGKPIPTVEWYYSGSYYNGQTTFTRGEKKVAQISFANVNLVNTGEYTCRARNGALDGNGQVIKVEKTINLYVKSPPKINEDASPTPVYSFVGNRKSVAITCTFYGYPMPTVIMRVKNGTVVARGNSSASYTVTDTTENDFGEFNCTAESPDGMAQYLVELRKAVPPGPPRDVTAKKTCKDITLMWKHPLNNGGMDIVSYIITVLSGGNQLHTENVDGLTVERNIDYDFKPKTTYEVRLKARSEAGLGKEEQLSVETDKYCVPGKPRITNTEVEVDVEDFTVTWSAPLYNGGDDNLKYRLEWRKKPITADTEVGIEENIGETQFKITGLESNEEYEIKLFSVNQQGASEPDIKTFKPKPDTAPPKINEDASPTPVYSFVGNRKPVAVTCTFYGYPVPTVIMRHKNGTVIARGNSSASYTVTDTTENDFGEFNCTAESPDGMAQYSVELKKAVPPGPPRNVTAKKTCKAITLMWVHPLNNGGMDIVSYIITVLSDGNQLYTEIVDGLTVERSIGYSFTPKTTYEVRIKASNEVGTGSEKTVFVTTYKYCVIGKPFITNAEVEVDTEFTVTWSAPQTYSIDNNTKYRLEWRKKPLTNETIVSREENINETRFRITGLQHNTEYEIKLYAVYRQRESEPDVRTFKTKPKVEGSSQSRLISSASLTILVGGLLLLL